MTRSPCRQSANQADPVDRVVPAAQAVQGVQVALVIVLPGVVVVLAVLVAGEVVVDSALLPNLSQRSR